MKPGRGLFVALLALALLGAAAFFSPALYLAWIICGLGLLPLAAADAIALWFLADRPVARRAVSPALAIGERAKVRLSLTRSGRGFLSPRMELFDLFPESMECSAFPMRLGAADWKGSPSLEVEYELIPRERGAWAFPGLELMLHSWLHLWCLKVTCAEGSRGRTYPDFRKMLGAASAELRGVTDGPGVKSVRRRGQGLDFERLREYREGDSVKAIDWRATARRQKFVVREYSEDRDQQVAIILDSGYRLHRRDGELLQFDYALDAALLLAYAALKREDGVAFSSFGNRELWLGPRRGLSSLNVIMNKVYDLQSASVPSSPFAALESALGRLKRRSLIVLISNFREEDGEHLSWILPRLNRRHLLLLVSLKEADAELSPSLDPENTEAAFERAASFSYRQSRRQLYKGWERLGLLTLETTARELSSNLINRYLDLKRSGRL
jgi:uncharacterized protein (DUF58 family)